VLRVGGRLAQLAAPRDLLKEPQDDFVADFVGRDRGYRSLGFRTGTLPLSSEPSVPLGMPGEQLRASTRAPWVLVVDDHDRPVGWVEPSKVTDVVRQESIHRGGTVAGVDGSLRAALDAALSSPSGRGVVVDADGVLLGTVLPQEVVTAIGESPAGASYGGHGGPGGTEGAVQDVP